MGCCRSKHQEIDIKQETSQVNPGDKHVTSQVKPSDINVAISNESNAMDQGVHSKTGEINSNGDTNSNQTSDVTDLKPEVPVPKPVLPAPQPYRTSRKDFIPDVEAKFSHIDSHADKELLNNKLTQDLENKTKELNEHNLLQDQHISNDTNKLTSKLSILNTTVTKLSSEEQILSQQLLNQTIASSTSPAFHVTLRDTTHSGRVPVAQGHKVIFQNKPLDIGNGYNTQTGIYTVTRSGKYVITWTININGQFLCLTHLMVNNVDKGSTWTDGRDAQSSHNEATTALVVLPLTVGDQLYIKQSGTAGCTMYHDQYRQTSFSGWLLY